MHDATQQEPTSPDDNQEHIVSMSIVPTDNNYMDVLRAIKKELTTAPRGIGAVFKPLDIENTSITHFNNCIRTATQYGATRVDVGQQKITIPAQDYLKTIYSRACTIG